MFIVSHGIIAGYSVKHRGAPWFWWAAIGSMAPDIPRTIERIPLGIYAFCNQITAGVSLHGSFSSAIRTGYDAHTSAYWDMMGAYSHSFIILGLVCIMWRLFSYQKASGYFLWGWFLHIVADLCSHYPPHKYFAPTAFALPFPSFWEHSAFWRATPLGVFGGSVLIEIPITFLVCFLLNKFLEYQLRAP